MKLILIKFIQWIVTVHGRQMRSTGEPYTLHLFRVATDLMEREFTFNVVIAAFCHDVLEDTDITEEALECRLRESSHLMHGGEANLIFGWVKELTEDPKQDKYTRKAEVVDNVRTMSYEALAIKYADFADNLSTIPPAWNEVDPKHGVSYALAYKLWIFQVWLRAAENSNVDEDESDEGRLLSLDIRVRDMLYGGEPKDGDIIPQFCRDVLSKELSGEALEKVQADLEGGRYVAVGPYRKAEEIEADVAAKKEKRRKFKAEFSDKYGTPDNPGAEAVAFGYVTGKSTMQDWGRFIEHVKSSGEQV